MKALLHNFAVSMIAALPLAATAQDDEQRTNLRTMYISFSKMDAVDRSSNRCELRNVDGKGVLLDEAESGRFATTRIGSCLQAYFAQDGSYCGSLRESA